MPEWVLIPSRCRLDDGSDMYEVKGDDIKNYFEFEYLMAINFWKEKEHFGLLCDWRKLTVQQKKLIMLFDDLKNKEVHRGGH